MRCLMQKVILLIDLIKNNNISSVMGLIRQQASFCRAKIRSFSCYELEDLIQDGVIKYYDAIRCFNPKKANFITYFSTVLRNYYAKIILSEYRNKHIQVENIITRYDLVYEYTEDKNRNFGLSETVFNRRLSKKARKVVNLIGASPPKGIKETKKYVKSQLKIKTKDLNKAYREINRVYGRKKDG